MATTTEAFRRMSGGKPVDQGEVIFSAGDRAESMFVVQEGAVEIRLGSAVLEHIGPGGIFGEMALIDGSVRSADAVAAEDSTILPIDQSRFDFMVTETPFFARTVMKVLAERIRRADNSST